MPKSAFSTLHFPIFPKNPDSFHIAPHERFRETKTYTTYREIARKIALSESLVGSYVTNLIEKGIPVVKKYGDGRVYLRLEDDFRREQAKNNIAGVNTRLTRWIR